MILIKSFVNISEGVLIKKYNEKHNAGGMFFTGILSVFALFFFVITNKGQFNFDVRILPYSISYGIIYCVSYFLTFVALSCGSFTMSMLIISYSLIFPILYGFIFLHETASVFTYIGFMLLLISLYLTRDKKDENETKLSVKWIISIVIVSVGNGLLAIMQKAQQIEFDNAFNNEFMIIGLAVSAMVLLVGGIIKDRKSIKEILRYGIPYAGTAGSANGMNLLLALYINNILPLSIVTPLNSGVKIVISFLFSKFIFKENFIRRQIIGVAFGTAALVFLNI